MRRVLYYPHMNLPHNCEALTTSILFSNELFIIAPERAPIDDRFTRHLIDEGVVKRLDPSNFLTENDFSKVQNRLNDFINKEFSVKNHSLVTEDNSEHDLQRYQIHREKLSSSHRTKLDELQGQTNLGKRREELDHLIHKHKIIHKGKVGNMLEMLMEKGLAFESDRGFYRVPGEISSFLIGDISRELALKNRMTLVTSNFGLSDEKDPTDLISIFLRDLAPDIIPCVDFREPVTDINFLIKIRSKYRDDLDNYIQNIESDVNSYSKFALQQYFHAESEERRRYLKEYILSCKNEVINKYKREYREFEELLKVRETEVTKSKIITAIPVCISVALAESHPQISAFMGGFANYLYSPNNDPIAPNLERHRVIHKIKKSARTKR